MSIDKEETIEAARNVGCAGMVLLIIAALIACVALGMLLGAAWGVAGAAVVLAALALWFMLAAKKSVKKAEEKE